MPSCRFTTIRARVTVNNVLGDMNVETVAAGVDLQTPLATSR